MEIAIYLYFSSSLSGRGSYVYLCTSPTNYLFPSLILKIEIITSILDSEGKSATREVRKRMALGSHKHVEKKKLN